MDSSSGAGSGGSDPTAIVAASRSPCPAPQTRYQYQSQKWRDWTTFLKYLRNHKPQLPLGRCRGAHVIEFLKYLDQFGKTKVHLSGCPFFGYPDPPAPCACPLRQAWGSLYYLTHRLRAAYEENGGHSESNPFATQDVTIYLREVREGQAKARGIPYEEKKLKHKPPAAQGGEGGDGALPDVDILDIQEPRRFELFPLPVYEASWPSSYSVLRQNWKVENGNGECDKGWGDPSHPYPIRPGEPDCINYQRTGFCRFGGKCHFNHPAPPIKDKYELSNDSIMEEVKDGLPKDRNLKETKSFCSIFFLLPEDYEFQEDTLIQLWMAGRYIKDELIGQQLFLFLLNEEYLLRCGTNFVTKKERYRINIKKIKHLLDGQRDNGSYRSYLKWENQCQKNTNSSEIQHVSLVCNDIDASIFQTLQQFKKLRTLLFLHNYGNKVTQIPDHLFQSFKELQALDLSRTNIKKLPSSVGYMVHLRYLDLSWTLIEWLADIICSLKKLQTLKLRGCSKLRGLPRQLKKLTKLRHLDVDVLRQLATIPGGLGALVNLQTLSAFLVGTEDGCKIQELKELNNVTGDFCIAMLENVGNADEAKEASLNKKQRLNKLELRWTASQLSRTENNCYDVLDSLRPCSGLKELQIFCYEGSTFPDWVSDPTFNQLVSITFFKCEHVSELPLIEQLPFLKQLELVKMNGVKKIERRGKPEQVAFSSLERLEIDEMQNLEVWSWVKTNEGDYKSLVELTINDCLSLCVFHVLPCLSSIKHVEIRECPKLESVSQTKLPDSLDDLIVEDCPRIKKKCSPQGEDWYKIKNVSNIRICVDDDDDDDDEDDC